MKGTYRKTKLLGDIVRIVWMFYGIKIDESSDCSYHFLTYLNGTIQQKVKNADIENVSLTIPDMGSNLALKT